MKTKKFTLPGEFTLSDNPYKVSDEDYCTATKTQSGQKNRVQTRFVAEGTVEVWKVGKQKLEMWQAFKFTSRGDEQFVTTQLGQRSSLFLD